MKENGVRVGAVPPEKRKRKLVSWGLGSKTLKNRQMSQSGPNFYQLVWPKIKRRSLQWYLKIFGIQQKSEFFSKISRNRDFHVLKISDRLAHLAVLLYILDHVE